MNREELANDMKQYFGGDKPLNELFEDYINVQYPLYKNQCKYIIITKLMSLLETAEGTSTNILISGVSGIGKDFIVKNLMKPFPFENHKHFKHITPKTLIGLKETPANTSYHFEEVPKNIWKDTTFMAMLSHNSGDIANTIDYQKDAGHKERQLGEKPVLILTSARPSEVPTDISRRINRLEFKDSNDLKNWRKRQVVDRFKNPINYQPKQVLRKKLQTMFEYKYNVKIPYFDKLVETFGDTMPTQFTSKLIFIRDLIQGAEIYVQGDKEDLEIINGVKQLTASVETYNKIVIPILELLYEKGIIALTGYTQKIYDTLLIAVEEVDNEIKQKGFTINEIKKLVEDKYMLELTTNTIVNHLNKLMDLGLIEIGMWRVNEENLRAIKSVKVNDTRLTFASIENPVFNKKIDNTNNTNNSDNTNNTNNTQTATPYSDVSNVSNVSKNIYNNNSEEEIEVIEVNRND